MIPTMSRLLFFFLCSLFLIFVSCQKENTNSENHLPKAVFFSNLERAEVNQVITFNAGESSDKEDPTEALEVAWSWTETGTFTPFSYEKTATHSYNQVGVYYPKMVIRDTYPLTDTAKLMIVIVNDLNNFPPEQPILSQPPDTTKGIRSPVNLEWYTLGDPENDPLTFDIWLGQSLDHMIKIKSGIFNYTPIQDKLYYYDTIEVMGADKTYYWQVAAMDPNGNYVLSSYQVFSTDPENP